MIRRPPRSPLFPYPPLSRSLVDVQIGDEIAAQNFDPVVDLAEPEPRASQQHLAPVREPFGERVGKAHDLRDRKSTRLNSSHDQISYAVFCLKKKKKIVPITRDATGRIAITTNLFSAPRWLETTTRCGSSPTSDQSLSVRVTARRRRASIARSV